MFARRVAPGIEIRLFDLKDAGPVFAVVERNRAYLREWLLFKAGQPNAMRTQAVPTTPVHEETPEDRRLAAA